MKASRPSSPAEPIQDAPKAAGVARLLADFNGDSLLDNGDIQSFNAAFLAPDIAADMNGDGFLDNGDINLFIRAFIGGTGSGTPICPF